MNRIKNCFRRFRNKMQSFMYNRYGFDELSQFLFKLALISIVIGLFICSGFFSALTMALYLIIMLRACSKNRSKRQRELARYYRMVTPVRKWTSLQKRKFSERKTHRYYQCGQCKTSLRVPKGKGKIKIRCPKCGTEIVKKT